MAFDLTLQKHRFWFNKSESISDFEDEFLPFCSENENYPAIDWLSENFYESPTISIGYERKSESNL